MKKILLLGMFIILFLSSNSKVAKTQTQSLPEYGYTTNGDFFMKESLVDKWSKNAGNTIQLHGLLNGNNGPWINDIDMRLIDKDGNAETKDDGYYVYQSGKSYKSSAKIIFIFKLDKDTWFPTCDPSIPERKSNGQSPEGWNLEMNPTDQISF